MRKMLFLAIALLASSLQAKDVKTKIKTVTYEGTKVNLGTNSLKVQFVDKLKGYEKEGYQGMDIQIVKNSSSMDPDEVFASQGKEGLEALVKTIEERVSWT